MIWVTTALNAAKMIKLETVRDRSDEMLINETMQQILFTVVLDDSVAGVMERIWMYPASRLRDWFKLR